MLSMIYLLTAFLLTAVTTANTCLTKKNQYNLLLIGAWASSGLQHLVLSTFIQTDNLTHLVLHSVIACVFILSYCVALCLILMLRDPETPENILYGAWAGSVVHYLIGFWLLDHSSDSLIIKIISGMNHYAMTIAYLTLALILIIIVRTTSACRNRTIHGHHPIE